MRSDCLLLTRICVEILFVITLTWRWHYWKSVWPDELYSDICFTVANFSMCAFMNTLVKKVKKYISQKTQLYVVKLAVNLGSDLCTMFFCGQRTVRSQQLVWVFIFIDSLLGFLTIGGDDVAMDCCGSVSLCGDGRPRPPLFTLHLSQEVRSITVSYRDNILSCGNTVCSEVFYIYGLSVNADAYVVSGGR